MPRLRVMVEDMVDIQRRMGEAALAAREDAARKPALIAMRRAFARQVTAVAEAIDEDASLRSEPALAAEFRKRLSEMRSGIALHQAKWPAVLLDNRNPEFTASAEGVIKANREFAAWALRLLR